MEELMEAADVLGNTEIIIITIGLALLILVLFIVIFFKIGIFGNGYKKKDIRIYVNDGYDIDSLSVNRDDRGLNGFGEDNSHTFVVGQGVRVFSNEVWLSDIKTGQRYGGVVQDYLIIGRKQDSSGISTLVIPDEVSISKKHVAISRNGEYLFAEDLGSSNHTWINGYLISGVVRIQSGDMIKMGRGEYIIDIY